MFKLGQKVRDAVTGFEGTAIARVEFLNGCVQFAVQGVVGSDGKVPEATYFDHQRLEAVDATPLSLAASNTGGPQRDVPSATYRG
jgi:hypothetical protein